MTNLAKARWLALLVPAALLGGAYISQYGFGLFPCEMCWWQRYPHFAAIALALLGFGLKGVRWPVALAGLAILASGLIGALHAGVEYDWWEGFTRCTSMVE
jgi:disulfide bond formation protein DsbB